MSRLPRNTVLDVQTNMLGALQTVDVGAVVGALGAQIGFEHSWELWEKMVELFEELAV